MYTLDQTLNDQKDLISLSANRELGTGEIFPPNAFYGINHAIKQYCDLHSEFSIKGVIPHGICVRKGFIWSVEKNAKVPVIFNYSDHRAKLYIESTQKHVLPFASPFLYTKAIIQNSSYDAPSRKGTLFFPLHSTHHIEVRHDQTKELIKKLHDLDEKYKPITICAYWKDYLEGNYSEFEQEGFQIVSAGHIYDKNFLFRLYHLCSLFEYSASNKMGSHIPYSLAAGCKYFHIQHESQNATYKENGKEVTIEHNDDVYSDIEKHLLTTSPNTSKEASVLLASLLGEHNFKSPEDLRKDLAFADRLDRYGFAKHPTSHKLFLSKPCSIQRFARNSIKKVLRKP